MFKKYKFLLLVLIISFLSYKNLLRQGYFPMHDDMQPIRVLQMDKCFKDGQIPCRWVPDLGYGYGYPLYMYYSPFAYYVMEFFHLIGFSILGSIKIEIILTFVVSGLGMYFLAKELWGKWGGVVSSVFYVYAPYRASDAYTRGAIGEITAFAFFPLIFWSVLKFIKTEKWKYLLYLSLSYGGLLLTHNISSLIFTPIIGLWILLFLTRQKKWNLIFPLFLYSLVGVGLAGFFIIPAFLEKKYVHVETMTIGYFNYLAHFVSLKQLFLSGHWGYGTSELGPYDDLSFSVGFLHWGYSLVVLIIGLLKRKKSQLKWLVLVFLALVGLGSLFMAHQRSVFIWNNLSLLSYLQFPWRFLTIVVFVFSLMAGGLIYYSSKRKIVIAVLSIFLVIYFNYSYFRPERWLNITDQDKFSGQAWLYQQTASIYDYLPIWANEPPSEPAFKEPRFIQGSGQLINYKQGTDWSKGKIQVNSDQAEIRLPVFYFPNFVVESNGSKIPINYDNHLGLISFQLPQGEHQFFVDLKNTWIRNLSQLLSILSVIFLISKGFLSDEKK